MGMSLYVASYLTRNRRDLSYTAFQYQNHGFISNSILVVDLFHTIYVVDFFINEDWYGGLDDPHLDFVLTHATGIFEPSTSVMIILVST